LGAFPIKNNIGAFPIRNEVIFLLRRTIFLSKMVIFPLPRQFSSETKHQLLEVLSIASHHRASIDIGAWWLQ